jgi:GT2 family glycosyltransferase
MSDNFVSIIIPVFNKWDYTERCLESLARCTPQSDHEVIVMDNGSTDATQAQIAVKYPHIKYFRTDEKLGFARANNFAVRHVKSPFVCFLNNDTEVTPNWLDTLLTAIRRDPGIAAVGPRLLYPDGTIQAAGVVFNFQGGPYHLGTHWRASHPHLTLPMEFNALTAACLLCRKELFEEAGGFNELYVNGFEDVDLCLTWRRSGYRLLHVPGSVVIHHESVSEGRHTYETDNIRLYFDRWRGKVVQDDLSYYVRIKAAHPSLPFIAAIVYGMDSFESIQFLLLSLLQHGDCALSILCIGQNIDGLSDSLAPYSPLITALSAADRRGITGWISRQTSMPGFCGFLALTGRPFLPNRWDTDICQYPRGHHRIVPLSQDARGFQSWFRFFANIPANKLGSLDEASAHLRRAFQKVCFLAKSTDETMTFFPREIALNANAIAANIIIGATPGALSFILPQWLSIKTRMAEEAVAVVMACMVFQQLDVKVRATINSFLKTTTAGEAELLLFKLSAGNDADAPIEPAIEAICRNNKQVACFSAHRPLTSHGARNVAASATAAPMVIFIEPGLTFGRGWLHFLLLPLRNTSVLGVSPFSLDTAGPTVQTNEAAEVRSVEGADNRPCRWITGPCTVFRRTDFHAAGGYIEKADRVETDRDLCARLITLQNGWFINTSQPDIKMEERTP